jgi:hypothetical protein
MIKVTHSVNLLPFKSIKCPLAKIPIVAQKGKRNVKRRGYTLNNPSFRRGAIIPR